MNFGFGLPSKSRGPSETTRSARASSVNICFRSVEGARLPQLLSFLQDHGWAGGDAPLEIERALAAIFAEAAIFRRELTTGLEAAERFLRLSRKSSGEEALNACVSHLHLTNYVISFCLSEDLSPLADALINQTVAERAESQERIADLLLSLPDHESVISNPMRLQRALAFALIFDTTRCMGELVYLVDPPTEGDFAESLHEVVFTLLVAIRAQSIRSKVVKSDPTERDQLTLMSEQFAKVARPQSPGAYLNEIWNAHVWGCTGLALSGGGLRAAFFHLGTLAFLAERDLLRNIEFISTVSGGTLTGTLYYLEVRALLRAKRDHEIGKHDYVEIVHRLIKGLLQGTRCNLRMRTFGDFGHAKSALVKGEFNRSLRLGLLYNKYFYEKYFPGELPTLNNAATKNSDGPFGNIRACNLARVAKISRTYHQYHIA